MDKISTSYNNQTWHFQPEKNKLKILNWIKLIKQHKNTLKLLPKAQDNTNCSQNKIQFFNLEIRTKISIFYMVLKLNFHSNNNPKKTDEKRESYSVLAYWISASRALRDSWNKLFPIPKNFAGNILAHAAYEILIESKRV